MNPICSMSTTRNKAIMTIALATCVVTAVALAAIASPSAASGIKHFFQNRVVEAIGTVGGTGLGLYGLAKVSYYFTNGSWGPRTDNQDDDTPPPSSRARMPKNISFGVKPGYVYTPPKAGQARFDPSYQ